MKNIIFITLVVFLAQSTIISAQADTSKTKKHKHRKERTELVGPDKEQTIAWIDKIVAGIKNEKDTYRKIISEIDIILNIRNQPSNIKECVFKKDKDIVIVQIEDTYKKYISDYYIHNERLIYIETKNNDNTIDKTYYNLNLGYIVADYRNGKEIEQNYTIKERLKMGYAMMEAMEKLLKEYKRK